MTSLLFVCLNAAVFKNGAFYQWLLWNSVILYVSAWTKLCHRFREN